MKYKHLFPLVILTLSSCSQSTFVIDNRIFCFDTMVETHLYEGKQKDSEKIEQIFKEIDKLTDNYNKRDINNIYTINNTKEEVKIDKDLYDFLQLSLNIKNEGGFYYNPLCGSLAKKWKESLKIPQILDKNIINGEIDKINNTEIIFKDDYVVQRTGDGEIDLGGIAKGYALDMVYNYLANNSISKYLINAGTSSILLGEKNTKDGYFSVGIKGLSNAYLKLKNCFISTSGTSEQSCVIDGKTYSHIINPITGDALCQYDSVLVICDKGYYSDAMSTSLMMNSIEEIKELEKEYGFKSIVIKDKTIVYSNSEIEVLHH